MTLDPASPDSLSPVYLAYLAAAVILPARLFVLGRAARDVPRLHDSVRTLLGGGDESPDAPLRRSSNPYAVFARLLTSAAEAGREVGELSRTLERCLRKTRARTTRGQALDAGCLLLLLGPLFAEGRGSFTQPVSLASAGFLALMLVLTMIVRARLALELELGLRDLAERLRAHPGRPSTASACAFCGAEVESVEMTLAVDSSELSGSLCRSCGKVVATLPIEKASL